MLVVAASTAAGAWLMREMVNSIFVERNSQAVWNVSLGVMIAYLAKGIATYFQTITMGSIGASIVARLQQRQFETLMTFGMGNFSIIVAHRLSTIQQADKIVVLDSGSIVAVGTHDSLMRESQVYQALFLDPDMEKQL